jgi:hypothetical protein
MIFITARYHPRPGPDRPNVPSGRLYAAQCSIGPVESDRTLLAGTISSTTSPPSQTTTRPAAAHPRLLLVSQRHRCSIGAAITAPMFHRCRPRPRAPGLSSPGGLTARSVLVLHGAGDLAEQRFVSDREFREYAPHR